MGGRPQFLLALAKMVEDGDENAQAVQALFDSLSRTLKSKLSFDELLMRSKVDALAFVGKLSSVMYEQGIAIGNVIAAAHHPMVVGATVEAALMPGGVKDRQMLLNHHGFLPQKRGSSINIGIVNQQQNNQPAASDGDERGLPTFESETLSMRGLVRR